MRNRIWQAEIAEGVDKAGLHDRFSYRGVTNSAHDVIVA
jgi:hypothetical protein